ncbi:glycoside hydrolase family 36 protein [Cucurbitaria berberidis CBS 394.84]|uniref:alpha-galactosidase n=1 Tax=Cucurbitaria berberidis CBS 394.84 TaxID=1168544 RepID=A0A9P4L8B9_9PLEO|nr:glycoside hydrolase family 36 protein [Cucurbitaria berberidis CBS 394.84]KAF1845870.1 glycoside hydrolase family 36 protein [Cucurbitaria berberidis CBS 394.84]
MTKTLLWETKTLSIEFIVAENGTVSINTIQPTGSYTTAREPDNSSLSIHQPRLSGEGNHNGSKTSKAFVSTYWSKRLTYVSHREWSEAGATYFEIKTENDGSDLSVVSNFTVFDGVPVLRAQTSVHNNSKESISLTSIPSLVVGGLTRGTDQWWNDFKLSVPNNSWFREAQWRNHSLPDIGLDHFLPGPCQASFATFSCSNLGTFSTGTYLPMGMLQKETSPDTWLWQVEHNGSWKWEIGDWGSQLYVALSGPTRNDHHWEQVLRPGESFTTVPAAICHLFEKPDAAFQALTAYRRRIRRFHQDNVDLPLIFNDYMNCLMGDPTEDKIRQLIKPATQAGAEYFVIDAGWYSNDSNWWDDIGLWEPSAKRFPSGFKTLTTELRASGLIPGLWVEPESIGVRSKIADQLPADAFFQQNGQRVVERDRYQLDFRHEAVKNHLDRVIDRLVTDLGVGYFKFDYNIEIIQGTDVNNCSPGAAQLDHNRAYLAWVTRLLDKYPTLVIESCSSGAQRMDYAMLSVHPLQSTSDQEDPVMYASIAAAVFTAVTPEQSATWAYPQKEWDDEINALTVVNSLLGRIHLSGRLDKLSDHQFALISEGMQVYKNIRQDLRTGLPFWPLGLPGWQDHWLSVGLICQKKTYLSVWRRGGETNCDLRIPHFAGQSKVKATLLYPSAFAAEAQWDASTGALRVTLPETTCARLFQVEID